MDPLHGEITSERMKRFLVLLERKGIRHSYVDAGDRLAGSIEVIRQPLERLHAHRGGKKVVLHRSPGYPGLR